MASLTMPTLLCPHCYAHTAMATLLLPRCYGCSHNCLTAYSLASTQVIVAIASGATPALSEATPASDAFHAFLAAALVKNPI